MKCDHCSGTGTDPKACGDHGMPGWVICSECDGDGIKGYYSPPCPDDVPCGYCGRYGDCGHY